MPSATRRIQDSGVRIQEKSNLERVKGMLRESMWDELLHFPASLKKLCLYVSVVNNGFPGYAC